jgi:hypothetical protein
MGWGGATWPGSDDGGATFGKDGDARATGGVESLGQGHLGGIVVKCRASIDFPAPGGPWSSTLWSQRLPPLRVRLDINEALRPCGYWFTVHM